MAGRDVKSFANLMQSLPKPAALLLDWDGTLVNTLPLIHACLNEALTALGQDPWTLEAVQRGIHRSARESFPAIFGPRWKEAMAIYYKTFEALHLEKAESLPGAENFLEAAKGLGIPMAVVSNKQGPYLRQEVEKLGWQDYFRAVVGATDAPRDKPDPAPVRMALEAMKEKAGPHIWFVGDSITDMMCAANSALTGVLIRELPPGPDEFSAARPAFTGPDCHALTEILTKHVIPGFTTANAVR
jgi:phosphoglycolate phosphatase